jgi:hypothetical protein
MQPKLVSLLLGERRAFVRPLAVDASREGNPANLIPLSIAPA